MDGKTLWDEVKANSKEGRDAVNSLHLGWHLNRVFESDVKHLGFTLSRYKFVLKLIRYREAITICELGCSESLGAIMALQNLDLGRYVGIDFDEESINWSVNNIDSSKISFICKDFMSPLELSEKYDLVFSLDVIEHISKEKEKDFCKTMIDIVNDDGIVVIGTPHVKMSPYASADSAIGHINLYDQKRLYTLMEQFFDNVFIFNMTDEIVHIGFDPMSCYFFAVCTGPKKNEKQY